jgi:hypothetical protein
MAHHCDTVRMGRHRLAQLLESSFHWPSRKHNRPARPCRRRPVARRYETIVPKASPSSAADEAQVHFAAPFVAQGVGRTRSAGCANEGRKGKRQRGRSAPTRNQASLHHRPPGLRSAFRP